MKTKLNTSPSFFIRMDTAWGEHKRRAYEEGWDPELDWRWREIMGWDSIHPVCLDCGASEFDAKASSSLSEAPPILNLPEGSGEDTEEVLEALEELYGAEEV